MSSASARPAPVAAFAETELQSFSALVLKPLLQLISIECCASLPTSALDIADFVIQLLTSIQERDNQMLQPVLLLGRPP
jgi:hypothetical protein